MKTLSKNNKTDIIKLIKKALLHEDNGKIGSLVTAQGELRESNFNHWIEENL